MINDKQINRQIVHAPPVFIVGMNGSGTTMLADSLNNHSDLYIFPMEARVLPFFMSNLHRYDNLSSIDACRRLARDIGNTRPFWQVNNKTPLSIDDSCIREQSFAGVVHGVFSELAQRQGKKRWGEKSPINLLHITALAKEFSDAQFIHIIRDGREVAQSFHRRWLYDPKRTIFRWKKRVTIGREQGKKLEEGRYLEVSYEQLTQNPEMEMQRICSFLNLTYEEKTTNSSMRMMDENQARKATGRIMKNSGKWKDYFSHDQVAALEKIAGRYLHELGYETTTQGDTNPSSAQVCYWFVKDCIAFVLTFFRDNGWRGIPIFLRVIAVSLMQLRTKK